MTTTLYVYSREAANEPRMIHAIDVTPIPYGDGKTLYTINGVQNASIANHASAFLAPSVDTNVPPEMIVAKGVAWTSFEKAKAYVEASLSKVFSEVISESHEIRDAARIIEEQECCIYCGRIGVSEDFCYMDEDEDGERASCESCSGGGLYTAADAADLKNDIKKDER